MTNKLITMVAVASVGCVALAAPETWFNGGLGSAAMAPTGGSWTVPAEGVTTNASYQLVLDEPDTALQFAAANAKLPEGTNLTFTTTANFKYSYDVLPAIDQEAKAGIVIYTNRFYVLGKDTTSNNWTKTTIDAGTVDGEKQISVVITNGNDKVFATYTVGGQSFSTEVYVKSDAKTWGTVSYKGCGIVAALAGQYEATTAPGYPIPGGDPIPADRAKAWASSQGISEAQLAAMLASEDTDEQGRTAAENCILGIAQNTELRATIQDDDKTKITFAVPCDPIAGRVKFYLEKSDVFVTNSATEEIELAIEDGIDGNYEIHASVDEGYSTSVSQTMTIKSAVVEGKGKVSYIGANMDGTLPSLMKGTRGAENDKLEYYDTDSNSYKSWTLTSGAWVGDTPVAIKNGQAVKYTSNGTDTLYMIGDLAASDDTEIKPGDYWNLVASTSGSFNPGTSLESGEQAIVLGDDGVTPTMIYRNAGGTIKQKAGYTNKWETVSGTISNGFFLKSPTRTSIHWGIGAE